MNSENGDSVDTAERPTPPASPVNMDFDKAVSELQLLVRAIAQVKRRLATLARPDHGANHESRAEEQRSLEARLAEMEVRRRALQNYLHALLRLEAEAKARQRKEKKKSAAAVKGKKSKYAPKRKKKASATKKNGETGSKSNRTAVRTAQPGASSEKPVSSKVKRERKPHSVRRQVSSGNGRRRVTLLG